MVPWLNDATDLDSPTEILSSPTCSRSCLPPHSQVKLAPFRFRPLDMSSEAPRPGMLLAIDAGKCGVIV